MDFDELVCGNTLLLPILDTLHTIPKIPFRDNPKSMLLIPTPEMKENYFLF